MQPSGQIVEATIVSIGGEALRFKFHKKIQLGNVSDRICEAFGKSMFYYFATLMVDGCFFDDMFDTPFADATNESIVSVVFVNQYGHVHLLEDGSQSPGW